MHFADLANAASALTLLRLVLGALDATLIAAPSSTKNEALNFEIARLKRWRFGSSSESLDTRTQAVLFDYILLDTALEDRAADETKKPAASPSRPKG